jgi:hypothetical protein
VLLEKQNVRDSMPKPRTSSPADLSDGLAGAPQAPLAMDSGLGDTDEAGRDWSNWTPGMPLPAAAPSGAVLADNARRAEAARVREADALARNEAIGTKYGPQARGIAEAGDAEGVTDYAAVQTNAEQFRNKYRSDLELQARQSSGMNESRKKLREQDAIGAEARNKFRAAAATTGTSGMPSEA